LRELLLAELVIGPEVLLDLPRATTTVKEA